jgi:hypothetical protein
VLDELATGGTRIRTFYFRHHFTVSDPAQFTALTLELLRDDGAAVYLNGTEVRRDNLIANAGYNDFATVTVNGADEAQFFSSPVDPALLRTGDNVLAVEVHQRANNSTDLSFDLRLAGTTFAPDVDEYTLDLTGKRGRRIDVALAGQGDDFTSATLELLAPDGATVLATGMPDPLGVATTNYDRGILDFTVPAEGVYTLRVSSNVAGQYALVVTEGHALEHEPNDSALPLVDLTERSGSVGYIAAGATDAVDRYQISLAAGEHIVLSTDTPMDSLAATPANTANPRLRLLTSGEATVASDNDSLDGHNARIETVVSDAGIYVIEVAAESGAGEYTLNVLHRSPPQITIRLRGSEWTPAFLAHISGLGLGDGGVELRDHPDATPLPWVNVDTVHIAFSQPVEIGQGDLRITGVSTPDYTLGVMSFDYNPASFTATWRLDRPFAADRVQLALLDTVRDAGGNPLGNISAKRFDVLPGDVTRDRLVRTDDFFASLSRQFSSVTDEVYDVAADADGSGAVNILDWQHIYTRLNTDLPPPVGQPSPESAEGGGSSATARTLRRPIQGVRRLGRAHSPTD